MAEILVNMVKTIKLRIKEIQQIPSRINSTKKPYVGT